MAKTFKKKTSVKKDTSEKVAPPKEEIKEKVTKSEVEKPAPKKEEPPKEADPVKDLPVALPSQAALDIVTSKALKTTVKFCGKWFKLVQGKSVTATASQIAYLRSCGLVE